MSSHSRRHDFKRNTDQPEQSPTTTPTTSSQHQHRRSPSATNSPHPTSRHDYHYYRHSSRRSNNFNDFGDEADDGMNVGRRTPLGIATSPPAGLMSPPVSPRVTNSRTGIRKTHESNVMDDGTKVLVSHIIATDLARQDYKEKVVALSTGSIVSADINTPLSPLTSPKNNIVVMKQRPPPPHRTNSSSQRSHLSSTHRSVSSQNSSSAHRRLVSPTSSIKDTKISARPQTTTIPPAPSWNDTSFLRTPSPHRNRVVASKGSPRHEPLFHSPPDACNISPKKNLEPPNDRSMIQYHRQSPRTKQNTIVPEFQDITPEFGRPGTTAFNVVTPSSPYPQPKQSPSSSYQPHKQRFTDNFLTGTSVTHSRDGTSKISTSDIALQEAKRREREQGPAIMSMRVQKKTPPASVASRFDTDDDDGKRQARIERHLAMQSMNQHRKSSERGASVVASRSRSNDYSAVSVNKEKDESLAKVNGREHDRGRTLSTSSLTSAAKNRVGFGAVRPTATPYNAATAQPQTVPPVSNTATALSVARDDMQDVKRKERERGPSLFSAFVTQRRRPTNTNTLSSNSIGDGHMDDISRLNDGDITAIKRRERESGPTLASATGSITSFSITSRRRTSTRPPSASIGSDPMDDMKQRERTTVPRASKFVRNTPPRSTRNESSSNVPSRPNKSSVKSNRVLYDVDCDAHDDFSTDDTAYALAMARTNLERKMLQETGILQEQEGGGPFTASGVQIHPGAVAFVGRERNFKAESEDHGPSLAPAMGRTPQLLSPRSPSRVTTGDIWSSTDIEAQAGVPFVTPGAFAVHGVSSRASDYESSDDSEEDYITVVDPDLDDVGGSLTMTSDAPLEAEVYEQVVLDGAVVTPTDEEEEIVDPKVLKRLRFVQISILTFALCAIGVIIGSILGFTSNDTTSQPPPKVLGWNQSGADIYGPTKEPQTFFGSQVAMSGDGSRIAIASPGTGNETTLNVGEVYIMEADQNENGTYWKTTEIVTGQGTNNIAHTSLAMTADAKWLAIGYARHSNGSRVQLYKETDGLWKPESSPLIDKNGTDSAWFGYSLDVSYDGTIIAVGVPQINSPNGDGSGGVQVFQKNSNGDWIQMGSDIFGLTANEFFGWTVSFSSIKTTGSYRIATASPVSNNATGVVRIYDWDDSKWRQVGVDLIGDAPLNRFGESIAMSEDGSVLAVGVRGSAFEFGQAKVYRENSGVWELDVMMFLGTEPGDGFGASVDLSDDGNVLAVGGPQSNLFGESTGILSVYRYDTINGLWKQQGSSIGSTTVSDLGVSVAISNDGLRVVAGAPTTTYDGSIARAGSVLVFDSDGTQ